MIYTIGEALIDKITINGKTGYLIGGAPLNVCGTVAKLGGQSAFIGKVGFDREGEEIKKAIIDTGINCDYLYQTSRYKTCVVEVNVDQSGERHFIKRTRNSADMFLDVSEVESIVFNKNDILHFCSVDLIDKPVRRATEKCIDNIKKAGGKVSFDPNIRLSFWDDIDEYKKIVLEFMKMADYIKLGLEDIAFLYKDIDIRHLANDLLMNGAKVVMITQGKAGALLFYENAVSENKVNEKELKVLDTTGAGDIYIGSFLFYITNIINNYLNAHKFAIKVSSLSCTKMGGFTSIPELEEIQKYLGD